MLIDWNLLWYDFNDERSEINWFIKCHLLKFVHDFEGREDFLSVFNVSGNKSNRLAKHIVMHCFRAYRASWGGGGR